MQIRTPRSLLISCSFFLPIWFRIWDEPQKDREENNFYENHSTRDLSRSMPNSESDIEPRGRKLSRFLLVGSYLIGLATSHQCWFREVAQYARRKYSIRGASSPFVELTQSVLPLMIMAPKKTEFSFSTVGITPLYIQACIAEGAWATSTTEHGSKPSRCHNLRGPCKENSGPKSTPSKQTNLLRGPFHSLLRQLLCHW